MGAERTWRLDTDASVQVVIVSISGECDWRAGAVGDANGMELSRGQLIMGSGKAMLGIVGRSQLWLRWLSCICRRNRSSRLGIADNKFILKQQLLRSARQLTHCFLALTHAQFMHLPPALQHHTIIMHLLIALVLVMMLWHLNF